MPLSKKILGQERKKRGMAKKDDWKNLIVTHWFFGSTSDNDRWLLPYFGSSNPVTVSHLSLPLFLSLSLSRLFFPLFLPPSVSSPSLLPLLPPSLFLSNSLSLYLSQSLFLPLSQPPFLFLSHSLSNSLSLTQSLFLPLSQPPSLPLSFLSPVNIVFYFHSIDFNLFCFFFSFEDSLDIFNWQQSQRVFKIKSVKKVFQPLNKKKVSNHSNQLSTQLWFLLIDIVIVIKRSNFCINHSFI